MSGIETIATPHPHYIPGYTGYCPQYIYRVGDTYGKQTHKLLIDPCISHAERIILSNRNADDYHVQRPTLREIDLVKSHEKEGDPVYKHPTIPGYEGFIPHLNDKVGYRYSIAAIDSIAEFEKHMQRKRCEARMLKHRSAVQNPAAYTRSVGERSLQTTDYKLPLSAVRPECQGLREGALRAAPVPPPIPYSKHTPPHFMNKQDPQKYVKLGYAGHIPHANFRIGMSHKPLTTDALCEFMDKYKQARVTEWSPIKEFNVGSMKRQKPITEIYPKTSGLIPNYAGHVPGVIFRAGRTFGNSTVDAKQWLKET